MALLDRSSSNGDTQILPRYGEFFLSFFSHFVGSNHWLYFHKFKGICFSWFSWIDHQARPNRHETEDQVVIGHSSRNVFLAQQQYHTQRFEYAKWCPLLLYIYSRLLIKNSPFIPSPQFRNWQCSGGFNWSQCCCLCKTVWFQHISLRWQWHESHQDKRRWIEFHSFPHLLELH